MKKLISLFLTSLLFLLVSCGADKLTDTKTTKTTNAIGSGQECSCTATYSPVCGNNGITYDNICIANCRGIATPNTVQGNCECSEALMVCGDNGQTFTECDARNAILSGQITKIVKFAPCGTANY